MYCNCGKNIGKLTEYNKTLHLNSCAKSKATRNLSISSFFKPKVSTTSNIDDITTEISGSDNIRNGSSNDLEEVISCDNILTDVETTTDTSNEKKYGDVSVQADLLRKCQGYRIILTSPGDIYTHFPFTLLSNQDFVFENGSLHNVECFEKKYLLYELSDNLHSNKKCNDLQYSPNVKKIIDSMNDNNIFKSHINNNFLSHAQLEMRVNCYKEKLGSSRLISFNQSKTILRLNKTLQLHQRFLHFIRDNKIHRLHDLVSVALGAKRSISYIVDKIVDAIDGIYNPHYAQDDKDLAFLILQFGGPALLEIVHRAIKLPSVSTAYGIIKGQKNINSSVNATISEVAENFNISDVSPTHGHMLKMDEHYIDQRARWCPLDNSIYGFCYDHGRGSDLNFDSYEDVKQISSKVKVGLLHMPKECMVMATASNSEKSNIQPIVIWPTCSKNEVEIQRSLIHEISDKFFETNGAPFLCWSSDGDSTRRQIFDSLMKKTLPKDSTIYDIISKLRFIDMEVGEKEETIDFDAKHLAKRMRNYFIGSNFTVGSAVLFQKDVKAILELSDRKSKHSLEELLNPKDKQNVSLATDFLLTFSEGLKHPSLAEINIRLATMSKDLKELVPIIDGVLSHSFIHLSINDQLKNVSEAAFTLLYLYRKMNGKLLPSQLYHDLQSTFENVFYCAAKFKKHHPDLPLFLMLLGTDILERLFGNMRQKNKSGFDNLDMIYISRAMAECQKVLEKHPTWVSGGSKFMARLCLDYSKPSHWNVDNLKMGDVNIKAVWEHGRHEAEKRFVDDSTCDVFKMAKMKVTLLKPFGKKKVGVNCLDTDYSQTLITSSSNSTSEDTCVATEGDVELADTSASIIDFIEEPSCTKKYDNQIKIDGEYFYKASIVRQLFDQSAASNDRLRRVQSLSRYADEKKKTDLENVIMVGDPLIVQNTVAVIQEIKLANKKEKFIDGEMLQQENIILVVQMIQLSIHNDLLVWSGTFKGDKITVSGRKCHMIQPSLEVIGGKSHFAFDRSLLMDIGVQAHIQSNDSGPPAKKKKDTDNMKECFVCKKTCTLEKMRTHIGQHIVREDVNGSKICGYCGRNACNTILERTNKKKGEWHYKPKSDCPYFVLLARKPTKANKVNPCSNYIEHCKICSVCVWKYNMKPHFKEMHESHEDIPEITVNEKELLLSIKYK